MFIASLSSLTRLSRDVWITLNEYLSVEDVVKLTMTGPWWHRRQLLKTIRQIRYFCQPIPATFIAAMNTSILVHLDLSNDITMDKVKYEQYLLHLHDAPLRTLIFPTDRRNESVIHVDIAKFPPTLTCLNLGIAFPKNLDSDAWRWHEALPHLRSLTWPRGRGILDDHFVHLKSLGALETLNVHGWVLSEVFVASLPESLTALIMEHSSKIIKQFCERLPRGLRHLSCPFQHIAQDVKLLPPELVTLYYSVNGAVQWGINDWWFASLPPTLTALAQRDSPRFGHGIRPQVGRFWYRQLPKQLTRLGPVAEVTGKGALLALAEFPTTLTDLHWNAEYYMSPTYQPDHFSELFSRFPRLTALRTTRHSLCHDFVPILHALTPHLTQLEMEDVIHFKQGTITWPSNLTSLGILSHDHGQTMLPPTLTELKMDISTESIELDAIAIPVSVTRLHLYGCKALLNVDLTPFTHVTRLTLHHLNVCGEDDIKRLPPRLVSLCIHPSERGDVAFPARRMWFKHLPQLETMQVVKSLV